MTNCDETGKIQRPCCAQRIDNYRYQGEIMVDEIFASFRELPKVSSETAEAFACVTERLLTHLQ